MATLIRLKQIESGSALETAASVGSDFSASVIEIVSSSIVGVLPEGVISGSSQLDGTTIKQLTIAPLNSDGYSLIVSGALAVVDATDLSDGGIGDVDSNVPAQIWVNGDPGAIPPIDPSEYGNPTANVIDQGEW